MSDVDSYTIVRLEEEIQRLEEKCERLEQEKSVLQEDKERLEAVASNKWSVWFNIHKSCWVVQALGQISGSIGRGQTASEAIDMALTHSTEKGKGSV